MLNKENIDRLPVIVSASNVEQLLGVPALIQVLEMKYIQRYTIYY